MWPRGGGIWDQDPELVKDFRAIRDFEIQWESTQQQLQQAREQQGHPTQQGGNGGLESELDQYINSLEDDGVF